MNVWIPEILVQFKGLWECPYEEGHPIEDLLADTNYVNWCLAQPAMMEFLEKFPSLFSRFPRRT